MSKCNKKSVHRITEEWNGRHTWKVVMHVEPAHKELMKEKEEQILFKSHLLITEFDDRSGQSGLRQS